MRAKDGPAEPGRTVEREAASSKVILSARRRRAGDRLSSHQQTTTDWAARRLRLPLGTLTTRRTTLLARSCRRRFRDLPATLLQIFPLGARVQTIEAHQAHARPWDVLEHAAQKLLHR